MQSKCIYLDSFNESGKKSLTIWRQCLNSTVDKGSDRRSLRSDPFFSSYQAGGGKDFLLLF